MSSLAIALVDDRPHTKGTRMALTEDRALTARRTLLPRPAWLSEKVWPFRISRLEVDGHVLAVIASGARP